MLPGGLTRSQLKQDTARVRLSEYLPWVAYDPERTEYLLQEGALGHIWECDPMPFLDEQTADTLAGILRLDYSERAVLQFILHADSHVEPVTDAFRRFTTRPLPLLEQWTDRYARHLELGATGMAQMAGIPTRRFRLFVCVKCGDKDEPLSDDTIGGIEEFLRGAGLGPRNVPAEALLAWSRGLFGGEVAQGYDPKMPIRKQVIRAQDTIQVEKDHMRIGPHWVKVMTPRVLPEQIDILKINQLFGGILGAAQDAEQIDVPFIYSFTILPQPVRGTISAKAEVMGFQKAAGSFLAQLKRRLDEFDWAIGELDRTAFYRVIPSLLILADNPDRMRNAASRVKRMWEGRGAVMQEERLIQTVVAMMTLPFGLYNVGRTVDLIDRHFIVSMEAAARMLPVQADFRGAGAPRMAFVGRKGQLIGLDIFDRGAINHNALIAAGSGAGKSVLTQNILLSHYRSGCKVRIIDIGYSYRKLTRMLGGTYLDIGEGFVLNPFDGIQTDSDIELTKNVIAQMCYSHRAGVPSEVAMTLIGEAVEWAIAQDDPENGVSLVQTFLRTYPEHAREAVSSFMGDVVTHAHTLAYTMRAFTREGRYGSYFHGRSTLDINQDDWTVLELERLMSEETLFPVVVLMVIYKVTSSLYLAEAHERVPTFILFDEAWKFLSMTAGDNSTAVKQVIEEGYRRARKYHGSFTIVTQSVKDTGRFGATGEVIMANSAFRMFLKSPDYADARAKNIIEYDPFTMKLLESVSTQRPRYSEVFFDTGAGRGVGRLVLDPYSYWLFTSDATDNARIEERVRKGKTYEQVISELAVEAG